MLIRYGVKIRPLGEVLPDQAIGILVGTALPGSIRVCKVNVSIQPVGNRLMLSKFETVIEGDGLTNGFISKQTLVYNVCHEKTRWTSIGS